MTQAEIRTEEEQKQDPEHELPPADPRDGFVEKASAEARAGEQIAAPKDAELQQLRAERDSLFDRLARLQAEFDNYRKRSAKENADFRDYAVADAAKSLLPVIDNFALALKNSGNAEEFKRGVELIYKQLQDLLQKLNVQRIDSKGELFDPRFHEAIEMVESGEVPDNHVLDELAPGYRIKERLLRPAMVRVARNLKQQ
ncbi:MAG TPA: nucleotide exchange factor GrpE [Candidatus Angelobacter sp.]|nr:nucleotide exchange factor GrpE [Candidatus Angelobacter sp.]